MTTIFCCGSVVTYRPQRVMHEDKFMTFRNWASFPKASSLQEGNADSKPPSYAVQHVQQVNYGPLERIRYFVPDESGYTEVTERFLIEANFEKVNSVHDKFFETNLYQKNPINTHHWRANIARPAAEIDLGAKTKEA